MSLGKEKQEDLGDREIWKLLPKSKSDQGKKKEIKPAKKIRPIRG